MLDPWLLLMAFAIENAAKGIIVSNTIKKNPSAERKSNIGPLEHQRALY